MSVIAKNSSNSVQVFWVAISAFSSFAVSIITSMILSRYFPKDEYGTYRQVIFLYNTLLVVFTAGLPRVFSYFLPRYDINEGKSIVLKLTFFLFLLGVCFSGVLYIFSDWFAVVFNNPELALSIKYFSPVPMFLLPSLGIEGVFSTYRRTAQLAVFTTLSKLIMFLVLVLPVIFYGANYQDVIMGWGVASFITFIFALYFKRIPFKKIDRVKTTLKLKDILAYSLPLLVASVAGMAMKSADHFYVGRNFGPKTFAEFTNGFMELPLVGMITFSIATVLMPLFTKMIIDKTETTKIVELWQNSLMKSAIIIYPMVVFFIFFAEETMTLMFTAKYSDSTIYFQIALFANFFNVVLFSPILLALGKTKLYSSLLIVFALNAWIGNYLVLSIWESAIAIAIFSTLSTILITIVAFYKTSKIIGVSFLNIFPINKLGKILFHVIICGSLVKIILLLWRPFDYLILNFLFSGLFYVILILLTDRFFKIHYFNIFKPFLSKFVK